MSTGNIHDVRLLAGLTMLGRATKHLKEQYSAILRHSRMRARTSSIASLFPWHSKLAVLELIELACDRQRKRGVTGLAETVRILTGSCPDYCYGGRAYERFREFIAVGGNVRILAWAREFDATESQLASLSIEMPEHVQVRVSHTNRMREKIPHYMLVSDSAYRFEASHSLIPASEFSDFHPEVSATICFNDTTHGEQLRVFFDELWDDAVPLNSEHLDPVAESVAS